MHNTILQQFRPVPSNIEPQPQHTRQSHQSYLQRLALSSRIVIQVHEFGF